MRAHYVEQACAGVAALRARVERLPGAQPKVGNLLESPAGADLALLGRAFEKDPRAVTDAVTTDLTSRSVARVRLCRS